MLLHDSVTRSLALSNGRLFLKMCMALHHSFTRSRVQVCGCVGCVAEKALDGVTFSTYSLHRSLDSSLVHSITCAGLRMRGRRG